jgi:hypothetical protein
MSIKDMQALYEEGHIAESLNGSELMLIEQGGVSKVLRMDTAAAYFQQYFEQNSACCTVTTIPSFIRFDGSNNDVAAYGVTQIVLTANTEQFVIPCQSTDSWRSVFAAAGDDGHLSYDNGVQINVGRVVDGEFIYLVITNVTAGTQIDSFDIALTLDTGSPAALNEQDDNQTYALVDANPAHATFQLSRV